MKALVNTAAVLVFAVAVSIPVYLANASPTDERREFCETMHDLARNIMTVRQRNAPVTIAMEAAKGDDYVESMVRAAYDEPRFNTDRYRKAAVTDFANRVYLDCLDGK